MGADEKRSKGIEGKVEEMGSTRRRVRKSKSRRKVGGGMKERGSMMEREVMEGTDRIGQGTEKVGN